jgi:hypothetical protein
MIGILVNRSGVEEQACFCVAQWGGAESLASMLSMLRKGCGQTDFNPPRFSEI